MGSALFLLYVGIDSGDRSGTTEALERSCLTVDSLAKPDAESALAFLEDTEKSVDCIVSAYHLAGMDGIEFSQERTSRPVGSAVPLVLFVKDGSESVAASAVNARVSGYVRRDHPDAIERLAGRIRHEGEQSRSLEPSSAESLFENCREELQWERERLEEVRRGLSHDLRSPLNVAKAYAQQISTGTGDSDNEGDERDELTAEITTAVDRIDSFLGGLNMLIEQGHPVVSPERIDLTEVARSAWNQSNTGKASFQVVDDGPPFPDEIMADRERTRGLFRELYNNAVDHGPPGITVKVGALSGGFYVIDDGPGIPESKRDDVFRVGMSDRRGRNGIGLARVKHIAAAHRWSVSVCEGREEGCRFEITGVSSATGSFEART
jgi:signal transduction histidine kinase